MKIKIQKKDSNIMFSFNENDYEFNYDNINKFIEVRLANINDSIDFETEEDLNDYQELLDKIDKEISKEDFVKAVKEVEEINRKLAEAKKSAD